MEGLDWGFLNSINVLTFFLDSVFAYLAFTNQSQGQTDGQSFFLQLPCNPVFVGVQKLYYKFSSLSPINSFN